MYRVYILPAAFVELKDLPGNVRQRIRRQIDELADDPRPTDSKRLNIEFDQRELRRLRLDRWRIIYGVDDGERAVDVLAIRKRPPYDYGDLETLLQTYL